MARTLRTFASAAPPTRDHPSDAPHGIRWPPLAIRIALLVLAIGVLVCTASSLLVRSGRHDVFFTDYLYPALNLGSAALVAIRAYRVTADRWAWAVIAAGMAFSATGDVVYFLWVPPGRSPSVVVRFHQSMPVTSSRVLAWRS